LESKGCNQFQILFGCTNYGIWCFVKFGNLNLCFHVEFMSTPSTHIIIFWVCLGKKEIKELKKSTSLPPRFGDRGREPVRPPFPLPPSTAMPPYRRLPPPTAVSPTAIPRRSPYRRRRSRWRWRHGEAGERSPSSETLGGGRSWGEDDTTERLGGGRRAAAGVDSPAAILVCPRSRVTINSHLTESKALRMLSLKRRVGILLLWSLLARLRT
jgi:hypothetical protein